MRIGFDGRSLSSPAGGVRRYVGELLAAIAHVDPAHELITFGAAADAWLPAVVHRRSVAAIAPTNLGWSLVDLPRAIRRERLDVFHAPAYTAPLRGAHPLVLTIHDVSYERHPEWYPYRRDPFRRWFYRRSARRADVIVTDSEFSRSEIAAAYDIDTRRIKVVPLGVSPAFSRFATFGMRRDVTAPYVLHVGDLHPRRNLKTLVRALGRAQQLSTTRVSPKLVLAGADRGERAAVEDEARRANIITEFTIARSDEELAALYSNAAAFAYPSRYEGFGLPLVEAMACGAPIVAARTSSIPEVVGDAGVLVDPDDVEGMAAALSRVLEDSVLASRLRQAGRERSKDFTWERTAILTLDAYRSVARK